MDKSEMNELVQAMGQVIDEKLDIKLEPINVRLDKMDTKIDRINLRLDVMDARLDKADTVSGIVNNTLDKIGTRLTKLELTLENDTNNNIHIIAEQHMDIVEKLNNIEADVAIIKEDTTILKTIATIHNTEITALKQA